MTNNERRVKNDEGWNRSHCAGACTAGRSALLAEFLKFLFRFDLPFFWSTAGLKPEH